MSEPNSELSGLEPDLEMQKVILKTLKVHQRPIFNADGYKVGCPCGWVYKGRNLSPQSMLGQYHKHVSIFVEDAVSLLLDGEAA